VVVDVKGQHASAPGAADWLGWVELVRVRNDDRAIENTARVLVDIDADIQCLREVEDRPLLRRFHDEMLVPQFLKPAGKAPYGHLLLLDGPAFFTRRSRAGPPLLRTTARWLPTPRSSQPVCRQKGGE
jgi:hypothetical protein